MVSPAGNKPSVQGKQVTDTDKEALEQVSVKDKQAAFAAKNVMGGAVLAAGKPAKPVTLHQDTTAATPKAAHVAEDIWGGQPPPDDLPPPLPSDLQKLDLPPRRSAAAILRDAKDKGFEPSGSSSKSLAAIVRDGQPPTQSPPEASTKPALPPRRRETLKTQAEQDAAFVRKMIEDEAKLAQQENKNFESDEILAKQLQEQFDAPMPQANLELNSVGQLRVDALKNQGYTFHKDLGICVSEDGESIVDLDQLNKIEEEPNETRGAQSHSPATHEPKVDVKNTGVDVKDDVDIKPKPKIANKRHTITNQSGQKVDLKMTDDQAKELANALAVRRAAVKQLDAEDSWSDSD